MTDRAIRAQNTWRQDTGGLAPTATWQPAGRSDPAADGPAPDWPVWLLSWNAADHRYGAALFTAVEGDPTAPDDPWSAADWWCYAAGPDRPVNLPPGPPRGQPK